MDTSDLLFALDLARLTNEKVIWSLQLGEELKCGCKKTKYGANQLRILLNQGKVSIIFSSYSMSKIDKTTNMPIPGKVVVKKEFKDLDINEARDILHKSFKI